MSSEREYSQRKLDYCSKLKSLFEEYKGILIVHADHVGSKQMQEIRADLRGKAVILMGKNTMIRRVMREISTDNPAIENLLPYIQSNIGLVFTNGNIKEIRDIILSNQMPAAARPGVLAGCDVYVPAGPTGCDPGQTAFFQTLHIPTKIVKGCIEITSKVHLIKAGDRVGNSEVALLSKLNVKPFAYGLLVTQIYDNGSIYASSVLDLSESDLIAKFNFGVSKIAALGLQIGYPTLASLPHSISRAFKKILALSVNTDFTFKESEKFKEYLANPEAFAIAAPTKPSGEAEDEPEAAADEESEDESDASFDLFD